MTKIKPLLQLALDNTSLEEALVSTRLLAPELDVIEAGTVLCASVGAKTAVKALSALYPDHIIVADIKVADAGKLLSQVMIGECKAHWMTVICSAPIATVVTALEEAKKYNNGNNKIMGDIQIELFGNWTFDEAKEWRDVGIKQAIYHRGRDAQASGKTWDKEDLDKIAKLCNMNFEISVTGGLSIEDLKLFKDFPIKAFIAGRPLRDAPDPALEARKFKDEISKYW